MGDRGDPHIAAVLEDVDPSGTVLFDVSTIMDVVQYFDVTQTVLRDLNGDLVSLSTHSEPAVRGWIRRMVPDGWDRGIVVGSRQAASYASRLSLLSAIAHTPSIEWLTDLETSLRAENKLMQARCADELNIRRPSTAVIGNFDSIERTFGRREVIVKPLGPSDYLDRFGRSNVVYARAVSTERLKNVDLGETPFLIQEVVNAYSHLRIVTVGRRAWAAQLSASGMPIDWRVVPEAHESFIEFCAPSDVLSSAIKLTEALHVGYSSQDWIMDTEGVFTFLDLNPAGQWLFLPGAVAGSITAAITSWLCAI